MKAFRHCFASATYAARQEKEKVRIWSQALVNDELLIDEVWEYLKEHKIYFSFVSLDCTAGFKEIDYDSHMGIERDIAVRNKLIENGNADEKTVFCLNHFSHNGKYALYDDMCEKASELGFEVSYDGMEIEV